MLLQKIMKIKKTRTGEGKAYQQEKPEKKAENGKI